MIAAAVSVEPVEVASVAPAGTCEGGCGTPMPVGQQCRSCAIAAVDRWLARKGRRTA